ncbi:MAG: aminotransferase-like domain-containing protein [Candidatus Heimdallarchaeaceae archaeon]
MNKTKLLCSIEQLQADWVYRIPESEIRRLLRYSPRFYFGGGKPGIIPVSVFHEIMKEIIEEEQTLLKNNCTRVLDNYNYGKTQGNDLLREILSQRLQMKERVVCTSEDLVITTGSQQMLYALNDTMINPGDIVLTTRPTYLGYMMVAEKLGARIVTLPSDENGLIPEYLEDAFELCFKEFGKTPKILYLVPYSDNPKGTTLTEKRKSTILDTTLTREDLLLIEDAAYKEIQFEGKEYLPLKQKDRENKRIAYLSTTTKEAASFRLGYSVLPEWLKNSIVKAKGFYDLCSSEWIQKIAAKYYAKYIDNQVPKLRKGYKERRNAMVNAIEEFMPEGTFTRPTGGFFVWYETQDKAFDTEIFVNKAIKAGVSYVPGHQFYPSDGYAITKESKLIKFKRPKNTMRLCYSLLKPEGIYEGIKLLGKLMKK